MHPYIFTHLMPPLQSNYWVELTYFSQYFFIVSFFFFSVCFFNFCPNAACATQADLVTQQTATNLTNTSNLDQLHHTPADLPVTWSVIAYLALGLAKIILSLISIRVNKISFICYLLWSNCGEVKFIYQGAYEQNAQVKKYMCKTRRKKLAVNLKCKLG